MADAMTMDVRDRVVAILAEQASIDPSEVALDKTLAEIGIELGGTG